MIELPPEQRQVKFLDTLSSRMASAIGYSLSIDGESWTIAGDGFISQNGGGSCRATSILPLVKRWLFDQPRKVEDLIIQLDEIERQSKPISIQEFLRRHRSKRAAYQRVCASCLKRVGVNAPLDPGTKEPGVNGRYVNPQESEDFPPVAFWSSTVAASVGTYEFLPPLSHMSLCKEKPESDVLWSEMPPEAFLRLELKVKDSTCGG